MNKDNYSIVITGEWPGAGQSTTAAMLAKKLHFSRVYAGFLFRKFAHVWSIEKKNMPWQDFQQRAADHQLNLDSYSFLESDFNEYNLHEFQHQLQKVNTPEIWDKIVDMHSLISLQHPGSLVEAKVGVLLDKTGLVKDFNPPHPIFKFLLVCPPEISSHRIIKRKIENGELPPMDQEEETYLELVRTTTTETIERHLRDWERYEKIYGIYRSDIYKGDIIKINTAEKSAEEVSEKIIKKIQKRLTA